MICDLNNAYKKIDKYAKFYLGVVIAERLYHTASHARTISDVPDITIKLPIKKDNKIDFEYMSKYIKALQYGNYL